MEQHNKRIGIKAELYLQEKLRQKGVWVDYDDSWYDLLVEEKEKIEVKSALLSVKNPHKNTNKDVYRSGRFDFTDQENRDKIWRNNIWIAFIVRWRQQMMLLGFCRAKKLQKKRYIRISQLRQKDLLTLDQFIDQTITKDKGET